MRFKYSGSHSPRLVSCGRRDKLSFVGKNTDDMNPRHLQKTTKAEIYECFCTSGTFGPSPPHLCIKKGQVMFVCMYISKSVTFWWVLLMHLFKRKESKISSSRSIFEGEFNELEKNQRRKKAYFVKWSLPRTENQFKTFLDQFVAIWDDFYKCCKAFSDHSWEY